MMEFLETDALVEQDGSGAITEWNGAAERLFGWSRAEAIGRGDDLVVPARNTWRSQRHVSVILQGQEEQAYERTITARHRDGREFPLAVSAMARTTPAGLRLLTRSRALAQLSSHVDDGNNQP